MTLTPTLSWLNTASGGLPLNDSRTDINGIALGFGSDRLSADMYAPNHAVDPATIDAREVREIVIEENVEAVITVKTKFHVELIFGSMIIDIFEKDGVVYTRQQPRPVDVPVEVEEDSQDVDEQGYQTPDDPIDVLRAAGGNFSAINAKHASRLEMESLECLMKELKYGETQDD